MKLVDLDIAIAGAGIGGLALATLLARAGCRVVVYDQMDVPRPVGSGFVLQPTGAAVLAKMGLLDKVSARGAQIMRMHGRLGDKQAGVSRTVLDVSYSKGQSGIAIQRVALFDVLFDAAIRAGVTVEVAAQAQDIREGTRASLVFKGGRVSAAADLVVDAMGANSPIQRSEDTELDYGALWATVPWPKDGPFQTSMLEQRYDKASRMAGVLPVGTARDGADPMATFFWSLRNRDIKQWKAAGREAWLDEVAALWPQAAPLAAMAEPVHARYRHHTRNPIAGRGVLRIGDAWHATSPQLGQGANMALLDAASLVSALTRAATLDSAVALHLQQRQSHVRLYQALSLILTPFYQSDSRILPLMRDVLIGPVSKLPLMREIISTIVTGDLMDPVGRIRLSAI
ncbi:MAG: FAD-dependent monooxygenase [Rhizobium sp.]|nr:FAD-dependent monooxygenase [Rhizobium sp.]